MPNLRKDIDSYLQKLLALQFEASKNISHKPTKGGVREKFVKQVVKSEFPKLTLVSGTITHDEWESSQCDFIWLKDRARVGDLPIYELSDCNLFMEIKSNAKHAEMVALNTVADEIHSRARAINPDARVLVGMFCYSTDASEKTVLKKFGFQYDKDFQGYCAYNTGKDIFKKIDFLFSLNIAEDGTTSPYIVIRDIFGNCSLYNANPVIANFFNFFKQ